MSDLYSPGDHRAGELMTDRSLVAALVEVELAWYAVLTEAGIAPGEAVRPEPELAALSDAELADLAVAAESGGNPVIPFLAVLRSRLEESAPEATRWLHKGLTSQDALDTAVMLQLRDVLDVVLGGIAEQVRVLRDLADLHRRTLMAGRTLTQHAVPTTFGLTAANWLHGVLDVADDLRRLTATLPVQVGGAAGTLAAITTLASGSGSGSGSVDPDTRAVELATDFAIRLGLLPSSPWHTNRRPVTRVGDALVAATDAWAHISNDVLVRARPEIGELSEGAEAGRGGSSTMPHKQNPILSVLVRRAGLTAPQLGATLHAAAAAAVDERPDGGWHAEWAALRTLARQTVVAGAQTVDLLSGLVVHEDRMRATAEQAADDLLAEQRTMVKLAGRESTLRQAQGTSGPQGTASGVGDYLGAADRLIDAAVERADLYLKETAA